MTLNGGFWLGNWFVRVPCTLHESFTCKTQIFAHKSFKIYPFMPMFYPVVPHEIHTDSTSTDKMWFRGCIWVKLWPWEAFFWFYFILFDQLNAVWPIADSFNIVELPRVILTLPVLPGCILEGIIGWNIGTDEWLKLNFLFLRPQKVN